MDSATVRLYNTFTRAKEGLRPLRDGIVRIYSCGPTVYRYVHIGNLRTFMLPDLLRRSLEYLGYTTEQVMNITDVGHLTDDTFDRGEDKMLVSARLENKSPGEIAAHYTAAFKQDAARLNIRPPAQYPHATHYIPQMIELIEKLIARGHAYEVDGTVYFDIASFPAYGKLSRNSTDKLLAGARGEVDLASRRPLRHSHRRRRQRLSASRGRDRPERRRDRSSGGEPLDARRVADARRHSHGEVRGQLFSGHGAGGAGLRPACVSVPRAAGEVPHEAELQRRGPGRSRPCSETAARANCGVVEGRSCRGPQSGELRSAFPGGAGR